MLSLKKAGETWSFWQHVAINVLGGVLTTALVAAGIWTYHEVRDQTTAPTRTVLSQPAGPPAPQPVKVQPPTKPKPAERTATQLNDPTDRMFEILGSMLPLLLAATVGLFALRLILGL